MYKRCVMDSQLSPVRASCLYSVPWHCGPALWRVPLRLTSIGLPYSYDAPLYFYLAALYLWNTCTKVSPDSCTCGRVSWSCRSPSSYWYSPSQSYSNPGDRAPGMWVCCLPSLAGALDGIRASSNGPGGGQVCVRPGQTRAGTVARRAFHHRHRGNATIRIGKVASRADVR